MIQSNADRLYRLQRAAAGEHREPPEEPLPVQLPAGVHPVGHTVQQWCGRLSWSAGSQVWRLAPAAETSPRLHTAATSHYLGDASDLAAQEGARETGVQHAGAILHGW